MKSEVIFYFNDKAFTALKGQSVAAALIANGQRDLRSTRFKEESRSLFCGIGICFDCVVTINGVANQRACIIEVAEKMKVESSR